MDDLFMENESNVGSIRLIGLENNNVPMWSINHYLQRTCNNYNKITTIRKICRLFQNGAQDYHFMIAKESAELFPSKSIKQAFSYRDKDYIKLASKETRPDLFWNAIKNLDRPVVFFVENERIMPLIDFEYEDAIKITSLNYNSPINIDIQGAIDGLIDIAYAGKRIDMESDEHIARQIGQSASNLEGICRASQVIEDDRTPNGVKHYARQQLSFLMDRQGKLNEKLGVVPVNVNIKV